PGTPPPSLTCRSLPESEPRGANEPTTHLDMGSWEESCLEGGALELGRPPIFRVRFFFDQPRAQPLVDLAFQGGAAVLVVVYRAGQLNESRPKILLALAVAEIVFHAPELLVDGFQFGSE